MIFIKKYRRNPDISGKNGVENNPASEAYIRGKKKR